MAADEIDIEDWFSFCHSIGALHYGYVKLKAKHMAASWSMDLEIFKIDVEDKNFVALDIYQRYLLWRLTR